MATAPAWLQLSSRRSSLLNEHLHTSIDVFSELSMPQYIFIIQSASQSPSQAGRLAWLIGWKGNPVCRLWLFFSVSYSSVLVGLAWKTIEVLLRSLSHICILRDCCGSSCKLYLIIQLEWREEKKRKKQVDIRQGYVSGDMCWYPLWSSN
jgi:hypothetical protein